MRCLVMREHPNGFSDIFCQDGTERLYVHTAFLHAVPDTDLCELIDDELPSKDVSLPPSGFLRVATPAPTPWSTCQAGLPAMVATTWLGCSKGNAISVMQDSQDQNEKPDPSVSSAFSMQPSSGAHDS